MKAKHLSIRIEQCLILSRASNCPRRKFGALLIDPERNVILMDGYNGGPRGGGALCDGDHCIRDGLSKDDVKIDHLDVPVDEADPSSNFFFITVRGEETATGCTKALAESMVEDILVDNPPIESGTHIEIGCVHAEMNVICNCACNGVATKGAWLVVTGEPCLMCAKLIHHAGIAKVIMVGGGYKGQNGVSYLMKHGIEVQFVEGPQDPRLEGLSHESE